MPCFQWGLRQGTGMGWLDLDSMVFEEFVDLQVDHCPAVGPNHALVKFYLLGQICNGVM